MNDNLGDKVVALTAQFERAKETLKQIADGDIAQSSIKGYIDEAYQQLAKKTLKEVN